jgi:hypothetical protein
MLTYWLQCIDQFGSTCLRIAVSAPWTGVDGPWSTDSVQQETKVTTSPYLGLPYRHLEPRRYIRSGDSTGRRTTISCTNLIGVQ